MGILDGIVEWIAEQVMAGLDLIRDYDNLSEKQLLDLLSSFVMADDTGLLCDAYNTAELGDQDCTKIYIMEKQRFPQWLTEHKTSLQSISDF